MLTTFSNAARRAFTRDRTQDQISRIANKLLLRGTLPLPLQRGERSIPMRWMQPDRKEIRLPGLTYRHEDYPSFHRKVIAQASRQRNAEIDEHFIPQRSGTIRKATSQQKQGLRKVIGGLSRDEKAKLIEHNKATAAWHRRLKLTQNGNYRDAIAPRIPHDSTHIYPSSRLFTEPTGKTPTRPWGVTPNDENRAVVVEEALISKKPTPAAYTMYEDLFNVSSATARNDVDSIYQDVRAAKRDKTFKAHQYLHRLAEARQGVSPERVRFRRGGLYADFAYQPMTKRRWLRVLDRWSDMTKMYETNPVKYSDRMYMLSNLRDSVRYSPTIEDLSFLISRNGKRRRAVGIAQLTDFPKDNILSVDSVVGNPKPGFQGATTALRHHLASNTRIPNTRKVSIHPINGIVGNLYKKELKARYYGTSPALRTTMAKLRKA